MRNESWSVETCDRAVRLRRALIDAIRAAGCDVIDIGEVGTPALYYAVASLSAGCGHHDHRQPQPGAL